MTGNSFRIIGAEIDRVEAVDTSLASLDWNRSRNIWIKGNSFKHIVPGVENPVALTVARATAAATCKVDFAAQMAFGGPLRNVDAVVARGALKTAANVTVWESPYADVAQGAS